MRGLCSISSSQLLPPAWGILGNWSVWFCSGVSAGLLVGWSYRQRRHCENPDVPNHVLKSEKLQGARRQASSPHLVRGLPGRGNFLQAPLTLPRPEFWSLPAWEVRGYGCCPCG